MRKQNNIVGALCLLSSVVFAQNAVKAEEPLTLIPADRFRLLIENVDSYLVAQGGTPLVVIVSKIPDPVIEPGDISDLSVALTPQPGPRSEDVVAKVFAVYDKEIACIRVKKDKLLHAVPETGNLNLRAFWKDNCDE